MREREVPYPERTTTMGDSDPVTTISPFQIISADDTIMPKLRTCKKYTNLSFNAPLYLKSWGNANPNLQIFYAVICYQKPDQKLLPSYM